MICPDSVYIYLFSKLEATLLDEHTYHSLRRLSPPLPLALNNSFEGHLSSGPFPTGSGLQGSPSRASVP